MGSVTRIAALWMVVLTGPLRAQQPAPTAATPDAKAQVAVYKSFYQADLDEAAKDYEKNSEALQTWYLNSLDKVFADRTKAGDLDASVSIKAERERAASKKQPTAEEVKAMPPILGKLREMYEPARKKIDGDAARQKDTARAKYLTNLSELEKHFTAVADFEAALAVKAEEDRLAAGSATIGAASSGTKKPDAPAAANAELPADVLANTPDFWIAGKGVTFARLADDETAFSNRGYKWKEVPKDLSGRSYTKTAGGVAAHLNLHANRNTTLEVVTATSQGGLKLNGWEETPVSFYYTDGKSTRMVLFRKNLNAGENLEIPHGNWSGVLVLLPR